MPAWIHNRADRILRKNPNMDESEAFAIATQQAHALGKSPEGYGTSSGRTAAKRKYRTPQDDQKTASAFMWDAFFAEIEKIAVFMPPAASRAARPAASLAASVRAFKPPAPPKPSAIAGALGRNATSTAIGGAPAKGMASGAPAALRPPVLATPAQAFPGTTGVGKANAGLGPTSVPAPK